MRRSHAGTAVTAAVAALSVAAVAFGAPALVTTLLGLALVAAPGYVWGEVLAGARVAGLERVAVAAGLALAVPVVGGVALYAAGVPLHRAGWAGLFAGVTLAGDAVLLLRGRPTVPGPLRRSRGPRRVPVLHAMALGAAVVIAAGALGLARAGAAFQHYPGFTALWLSPSPRGANGRTADLGVSNQQGGATRYRLVLLRNGHASTSWNLMLAAGQTWQRTISLAGKHGTAAYLYRLPDLAHPYRHVVIGADRVGGSSS
jgi:hypothetical protein